MSLPTSNDTPAAWTDSAGRTWSMAITVNDNRRVLKLLGIDLFDLFDGKLLERLSCEPILLVDTLYAICKPQADDRGVTEEQFAELLIGDTIEEAAQALVQGLLRFFPRDQRTVLGRLWEGTQQAKRETIRVAETKLSPAQMQELVNLHRAKVERDLDQELARIKAELSARASDTPSTNSPASLASIPVP